MASSHMVIQNLILWKRYVRHLRFHKKSLDVIYVGGNRARFYLEYEPTDEEVAAYEVELEDRD